MNRNENEAESFADNFVASDEQLLFFEVPYSLLRKPRQWAPLRTIMTEIDAGAVVWPACDDGLRQGWRSGFGMRLVEADDAEIDAGGL
jgi:hypothetical protein